MSEGVRLDIVHVEGVRLLDLVEQFQALVEESDELDPALARLTPTPYPDDEASAAEFRRSTRDDVLAARSHEAAIVAASLASFRETEDMTEREAMRPAPVDIPFSEIDAWLRTLTSLRLVLATRLEISQDDDHDLDDPRFGVYDWLGYRLEMLIRAADDPVDDGAVTESR